ncbi:lipoprotein [Peribacillus sp. SCS-155]|uniref:lipoprotein n=1 Tax=Peribacillus sedimenti TaxID=3115297 RepID=UPI003905EA34
MKKILSLFFTGLVVVLAGCSVELDTSSADSKGEKLAGRAEVMETKINHTTDILEKWMDEEKLTKRHQERLVSELDDTLAAMNVFLDSETPVLLKKVQDFANEELEERKNIIKDVQNKAEKGLATKADLQTVIDTLDDDVNINLLD